MPDSLEAEKFSLICTVLQHRRPTICTFVQNIYGGHNMWLPVLLSLKPLEPVLHPWTIWLVLHLRKDRNDMVWIRRIILGITVTCVASCCFISSILYTRELWCKCAQSLVNILGHLRWFASPPVIIFQGKSGLSSAVAEITEAITLILHQHSLCSVVADMILFIPLLRTVQQPPTHSL